MPDIDVMWMAAVVAALYAAAATRATGWRRVASRPMTAAAVLFPTTILLRQPNPGADQWLLDHVGLANLTEVAADTLTYGMALALMLHILIAVGRRDLTWPVVMCTAALCGTALAMYATSDMARSVEAVRSLRLRANRGETLGVYDVCLGLVTMSAFLFLLYGTLMTRANCAIDRVVVGCYLMAGALGGLVGLSAIIGGFNMQGIQSYFAVAWILWLCCGGWLAAGLILNSIARRRRPDPVRVG